MRCFTPCYAEKSKHHLQKQQRGSFDSSDGYDGEMNQTVSVYIIPERMMGLREDFHQTRKRLAEYKVRLVGDKYVSDALKEIQSGGGTRCLKRIAKISGRHCNRKSSKL